MVEASGGGPQSVTRSLRLLLALAEMPDGARIVDLSERLDLPGPTVHRLLRAMLAEGFALQNPSTRRYEVGPSVVRLADISFPYEALRHHARPVLERLCADSGETVFLSVRNRDALFYVDTVMPAATVRMSGRPGAREPLHATSQGKVLLAFAPPERRNEILQFLRLDRVTSHTITDRAAFEDELTRVRADGFAVQDEEREEGIRAVSAPVLDPSGWPVAAVCVGAPAFRRSLGEIRGPIAGLVVAAAREVAARLFGAEEGRVAAGRGGAS
jgi:DNA-binding IclR family transcriptional regulator